MIALMVFSCSDKGGSKDKKNINDFIAEYGIQTIDYEDCEYIIYKDKKAGGTRNFHPVNTSQTTNQIQGKTNDNTGPECFSGDRNIERQVGSH